MDPIVLYHIVGSKGSKGEHGYYGLTGSSMNIYGHFVDLCSV